MSDQLPESRLERAAESTFAKATARFIVPILLLAILGWISDVKSDIRALSQDLGAVKSDIRDVNTRLDERVLRQVDSNTGTIADHEKRIQRLERAVQVP